MDGAVDCAVKRTIPRRERERERERAVLPVRDKTEKSVASESRWYVPKRHSLE